MCPSSNCEYRCTNQTNPWTALTGEDGQTCCRDVESESSLPFEHGAARKRVQGMQMHPWARIPSSIAPFVRLTFRKLMQQRYHGEWFLTHNAPPDTARRPGRARARSRKVVFRGGAPRRWWLKGLHNIRQPRNRGSSIGPFRHFFSHFQLWIRLWVHTPAAAKILATPMLWGRLRLRHVLLPTILLDCALSLVLRCVYSSWRSCYLKRIRSSCHFACTLLCTFY